LASRSLAPETVRVPQTLGDIKALLAAHGLRPRKALGQHFLHDPRKLRQIVEAAEVRPGDMVLEVGPGTGVLSQRLLETGARLLMVEIDASLEPILREALGTFEGCYELVIADVLSGKHEINPAAVTALDRVLAEARTSHFALVANLPYNVASPLLANLALHEPRMRQAVVMVQREVGQRIAAKPGGKDYGPLGILLQALFEVRTVTTLPPGAFWPPPEVDSVVLRLTRRDQPLTREPQRLANLLQRLFSQRRKQLGRILGRDHPLPPGVAPAPRPQQLAIQQLVDLSLFED